jgi:hypothetical protein
LVEIVVVGVELIRLALNSQVTARKHESELPRLVLVLVVDRGALFILRPKSQKPREGHVVNGTLVSLSGPCNGVVIWVIVVGAMEVSKNFLVPVVPKTHDVIETNLLALLNHGVEHSVVEVLIVLPINLPHLHNGHHVLCHQLRILNDNLEEIPMEVTPKPCLTPFTLEVAIHILLPLPPHG